MRHSDFQIGNDFWCDGKRWRCTDVGSRVVVAVSLEPHDVVEQSANADGSPSGQVMHYVTDDSSWLVGPPYAIVECVFDEGDLAACSLMREPAPHQKAST